MALLIFTAFSPNVPREQFDYSDNQNMGYLATYFAVPPSTVRLIIVLLRISSLFTSGLAMWVALYQAERIHEITSL